MKISSVAAPSLYFPFLSRSSEAKHPSFELGKTAGDTHKILGTIYGNEALSRLRVCEWFKIFREGYEKFDNC